MNRLLGIICLALSLTAQAQWPGYSYPPVASSGAGTYLPLAGGTMAGHLLFSPDNTYDIGASGATRPRNLYVGTSIYAGNANLTGNLVGATGSQFYWTSRSVLQSPSDGVIFLSNNAATDFSRLQLGGTTNSFPAIKRSGSGIQFRAADDSDYISTVAASVQGTQYFYAHTATAIPAGGTAGSGYRFSSTANFGVFFGSGAPTLAAAKGSLYLRSDGSTTNDRMYVNTDGGTTWTAVMTAG